MRRIISEGRKKKTPENVILGKVWQSVKQAFEKHILPSPFKKSSLQRAILSFSNVRHNSNILFLFAVFGLY